MKRRDAMKVMVGAAAALSLLGARAAARRGEARPNVLLLFSDQHHAGALGLAGNRVVRTPNMDRLAAGGTRFTRAYCQDAIWRAGRARRSSPASTRAPPAAWTTPTTRWTPGST